MVIRLISVSDQMPLHEFHDVFRTILGWKGDLGYIIRVHGQEINSFRRKTRSKALHEFKLRRQEKFLYVCDILHMWEWDIRVLDIQEGSKATTRRSVWVAAALRPRSFAEVQPVTV
jgi:Plasmid pRiA4b ORF-3-like protein